MKLKLIIFSLLVALIFSACKTTRTIPKTDLNIKPVAQLIEQVQKVQPQFATANVSKMSMALNMDGREVNVSATCKVKKDSALHISIQPFMGIELFKVELLTDSLKVFDKMNRKYYVLDYGFFKNRFGVAVNFYDLQDLLFGQFFCVGQKNVLPDSCKLTALEAGRNKIEYESESMIQNTNISPLNIIEEVLLKAKNTPYQLQTNYTGYAQANGVNYPQKIAIVATNQKNNASCDFSILKVEFNTDINFKPANIERYSLGDIDQLLKK